MFKNAKLGTKLAGGFGVLVIIAGVLGYMGWSSLETVGMRVENACGANALLQYAGDARLAQMKYMYSKEDQHAEANADAMAQIYT